MGKWLLSNEWWVVGIAAVALAVVLAWRSRHRRVDEPVEKKARSTPARPSWLTEKELLNLRVDVWKKTVDVQMHFNDLSLRVRSIALTLLAAILTAAGLGSKEPGFTSVFGVQTPIAVWLIVVALVTWGAFYLMDRWWYHLLLKGAVDHAAKLETDVTNSLGGDDLLALGIAISTSSAVTLPWSRRPFGSIRRLNTFYLVIAVILFLLAVILQFTMQPARTNAASIVIH